MTRYELTERIGSGAMAEIFRGKAVAAGGFEKPVAIKRILPHLSQDAHFVELLIAEANIVSHLRHRNVVQVFDVGQGPDGQYFLVMELVDGCNLGTLQSGLEARGKRMPAGLGLYIGAEICDALEHAHRAPGPDGKPLRLVHRDVSPNNVLLSRSGEVKLTDFGIAKRTEEVSLHGGVRGKFAYISPEQGSGRAVDARSDVFSVGILLFELVLGRRLFSGLPDFEALRAVCEGNVPRPRSVDPKLDPKLETILLKALAHDPDERYASASDLGKELRGYRYSLPQASGDPAAELASLVTRIAKQGGPSRPSSRDVAGASVPRPGPDDFSGGTNTFTLEEDQSLVRKTTYEQAWQRFRAEEGRVARTFLSARESGEMPSATVLGIPPVVGLPRLAGDDHGGDMGEEETRVVDPILRSSRPATRATPGMAPAEGMSQRVPDMLSEAATQPIEGYPGHGLSALLPGTVAPASDVEGVPPETLELRESQAHAMVDSVDPATVAHQTGGMPRSALPDAAMDTGHPSGALPRARAADPAAVIRVSTVPAGTTTRMGFPRWAVILFVVLLVCILLAGFFLGDGTSGQGASGVTAQPAAMAVDEPPAPAENVPAQAAQAAPAQVAAAEAASGEAAAPPVDAGPADAASAAPPREEPKAQRRPRRQRAPEKPQPTRDRAQPTREKAQRTDVKAQPTRERAQATRAKAQRTAEKAQPTRSARQKDKTRDKRRGRGDD